MIQINSFNHEHIYIFSILWCKSKDTYFFLNKLYFVVQNKEFNKPNKCLLIKQIYIFFVETICMCVHNVKLPPDTMPPWRQFGWRQFYLRSKKWGGVNDFTCGLSLRGAFITRRCSGFVELSPGGELKTKKGSRWDLLVILVWSLKNKEQF